MVRDNHNLLRACLAAANANLVLWTERINEYSYLDRFFGYYFIIAGLAGLDWISQQNLCLFEVAYFGNYKDIDTIIIQQESKPPAPYHAMGKESSVGDKRND